MPSHKVVEPLHGIDENQLDNWFNNFVSHLQADHFLIKQGVASEETKKYYTDFIQANPVVLAEQARNLSSKIFIHHIVVDYLTELSALSVKPLQLHLGLSDSKILVWAVINNDDEKAEDALLLAEAKVNSTYYKKGFYITSTILEESDGIPAPPHYHQITI